MEKVSNKPYMFTGGDIRHFKMIVYASSERRAKDYIRRESIGSTAHRTLKFRGEGLPVDPSGIEWVAVNASNRLDEIEEGERMSNKGRRARKRARALE